MDRPYGMLFISAELRRSLRRKLSSIASVVDDVALPSARALVSRLEEEPHVNPSTGTKEFSLRDLDGYFVTISALNPA